MPLIIRPLVDNERDHAAVTTNNEFTGLAIKIRPDVVLHELRQLSHFLSLSPRHVSNIGVIKNYLINGWNTERMLKMSATSLTTDALPSGLQWGFPMAYY